VVVGKHCGESCRESTAQTAPCVRSRPVDRIAVRQSEVIDAVLFTEKPGARLS
jgi:hypothetical protein